MERTKGLVKRAEEFADSKDRANLASKYTAWKEGFIEGYLAAVGDGLASGENVRPDARSGLHLHSVTGSFNLNIIRQWFDAVEDLNPGYLQKSDYKLAKVIYEKLDFPIPKSISSNCR